PRPAPVSRSGPPSEEARETRRYHNAMVRRDETEAGPTLGEVTVSGCAVPAGASPAPVSAGAPGSRPHPSEGDLDGRAGRRKPVSSVSCAAGSKHAGRNIT